MSAHTPVPWELFEKNGVIAIRNPRARSSKSEIVFWSGFEASHYPKQASANAALIVRAVNRDHHFDALVKALEGLLPWLEDAETKCLVGDEGCVWAVEHVRDILASVGTGKQP